MTGNIMTAEQAQKEYGSKYAIYQLPNDQIQLKNSAGRKITVHRTTLVYHRGNGRFARYSENRDLRYDKARKQSGWKSNPHNPTPKGKRRHQGDTRRSKSGGYV